MGALESVKLTVNVKLMKNGFRRIAWLGLLVSLAGSLLAQSPAPSQELVLQLDPDQSRAEIVLVGNLHTVEGTFLLRHGTIHFDPATGKASGEVVFDATSGKTGNSSRDRKMHSYVLESQRYPNITLRADRAEGSLAPSGTSKLQVHGMFGIHGAEREVTIPVEVNLTGNQWTAKASFQVPYVQWGMKNPSVLFLRVNDSVEVRFHAAGSVSP